MSVSCPLSSRKMKFGATILGCSLTRMLGSSTGRDLDNCRVLIGDGVPVDIMEERVPFDFLSVIDPRAKPQVRVSL